MKEENPILHKPVEHVVTSDEFLEMCQENNFKTLNQIIQLPVSELMKKPKFSMRVLKELYTILKSYNLEKLLKE